MKNFLKQYIQANFGYEYIYIDYYNISGSECNVKYYIDDNKIYSNDININIWNMLIFLESQKKITNENKIN